MQTTAAARDFGSRSPRQRTAGLVEGVLPVGQVGLLGGGHGPAGEPVPVAADLGEGRGPDLDAGVGQAGEDQVVDRLEGLEPGRRGGLDAEPVEDVGRRRDRRGPADRGELEEPGAEPFEDRDEVGPLGLADGRVGLSALARTRWQSAARACGSPCRSPSARVRIGDFGRGRRGRGPPGRRAGRLEQPGQSRRPTTARAKVPAIATDVHRRPVMVASVRSPVCSITYGATS